MDNIRIVSFIGSAQRPSQTWKLAALISEKLGLEPGPTNPTFDLRDVGPSIGAFSRTGLSEQGEAVVHAIETADALIVGSPVHKGSYPGLFKHVFDLVDPLALVGKPVALVATGGGPRHSLVVEHQLRPLFGFFCAMTMPTSVYVCGEDFDAQGNMRSGTAQRIDMLVAEFRSALLSRVAGCGMGRVLSGSTV